MMSSKPPGMLIAGAAADSADAAERISLTEYTRSSAGAFAGALAAGLHLRVGEAKAGAYLEESLRLAVSDVAEQAADEVEAVVALPLDGLATRAGDQLPDDVGIGHTPVGEWLLARLRLRRQGHALLQGRS